MARRSPDSDNAPPWRQAAEYLGGARDAPPAGWPLPAPTSPLWGVWWFVLIVLIVCLSGQATKFIYIDF